MAVVGEYDIDLILDAPDNVSATSIGSAVAAGGAMKSSKTTVQMTAMKESRRWKASSITTAPKK